MTQNSNSRGPTSAGTRPSTASATPSHVDPHHHHAASESYDDDDDRPQTAPSRRARVSYGEPHYAPEESRQSDLTTTRRPGLARSRSEYPGGSTCDELEYEDDFSEWGARHGFEDHYQSADIISQLANNWYMYFTDLRHDTTGKPKQASLQIKDWRQRERLKTVSALLVVCLNIGVEPPDQLRTVPGAKLEAWEDTTADTPQKSLEKVGNHLQQQFEGVAIRTRYTQYLDPPVEKTKKYCISHRRSAKDERVLFYYNGHGVPKPTSSGEIWVFNKGYTQYIPVSLYDLQLWLQAPTIFIWDCSEAGNILENYHRFVEKHEKEEEESAAQDPGHHKSVFRPYIHLAACSPGENLPTNPRLPADVFTACLTTPVEMALWSFVLQNPLKTNIDPERARKFPGRPQERRSPIGELNWILTAITDTIAWTSLPRDVFRKYFRQDLLVAGLFRNFLLAQRIMSVYGCTPKTYPELPDTRNHPQWKSWDLAVDMALAQFPSIERVKGYEYQYSSYFTEQLTAFDIYLTRGEARPGNEPEQLPVVLQVLLSQQHRVRALILLGKFLDHGPWAVELALSIGIFPYVLKLLQSNAVELKPVMVFIWARIIAVDNSCQLDLIKDSGFHYFAQILKPTEGLPVVNGEDHKAMCAFILSMICRDYRPGQSVCNDNDIMTYCLVHLENGENPELRQWACLCLSQLWKDLPEAKIRGVQEGAPARLAQLTKDRSCEVRAAVLHAMTTFLGTPDLTDEMALIEESLAWTVLDMATDGSPIVRKEFVVFLSHFVLRYGAKFLVAAYEQLREELEYHRRSRRGNGQDDKTGSAQARLERQHDSGGGGPRSQARSLADKTVFAACWKHVLILNVDPHPEVQQQATIIADYLHHSLLKSSLGSAAEVMMREIRQRPRKPVRANGLASQRASVVRTQQAAAAPPPPSPGGLLRRTASILLLPFLGAEDRTTPNTPPPTSSHLRPSSSILAHRHPSPLDQAVAPPEQNDQANAPADYNAAREPVSGGFAERDLRVPPKLPLESAFFDWSVEYYRTPQMKPTEADEPGSADYNERLWRRSRNDTIIKETQPLKQMAGSSKWSNQVCMLNNSAQPAKLTFHQFEDHLAVADDGNTVSIWDWKKNARLNSFSNGNPEGSAINDMKYINEDDQAFLMTGSSDGVVRVYRRYNTEETELASAWRALTHMVPSSVNSGIVFDWQQVRGRVLVAGDVRLIRLWHVGNEVCETEIPARSGSCVTSLTSDQMTGNIFVAGFGDGAVRVFDTRERPQNAMVRKWKDERDRQWIKAVHMQRGGRRELMSAGRNGKVRLWDIRADKPLHIFRTTKEDETLRTASMHEHLPVFAVGTSQHVVRVFNVEGHELSHMEPSSNLFAQSRRAMSAVAFHPHRQILACSARGDHHINLFTCEKTETWG